MVIVYEIIIYENRVHPTKTEGNNIGHQKIWLHKTFFSFYNRW